MSVRNPNPGIGAINFNRRKAVSREARTTLAKIRNLARLEAWIRCAKAELASTPHDALLAEFIRMNEILLIEEREKLLAA